MQNQVKLKCGIIERIDSNIIVATYHKDFEVRLEDAIEVDKAYQSLANGDRFYAILDSTNQHTYFTKEAQRFLAHEGDARLQLLASIVVLNQLSTRILARFFISFHKPIFPMKIIKSMAEAKIWVAAQR